jgi:hypothetical protein
MSLPFSTLASVMAMGNALSGTMSKLSSIQAAAKQGFAAAQFRLGQCYAKGLGVLLDEAQAAKWLQQVAKHGFTAT